ncbi:hypothetical protein [Wolbachia endosymbiont of Aedes albopictus]|uniref:hypothetical protein n=1 Tax=Wolbachia endosymbiont of Aedes albopictus TaxID=167957 RepID=UPI000BBC2779|nr:hypothetical protein [Wolbachia endosymbiont of Aedes albopictus]UVW83826.1 hypothetical protein NHG98_05750 [Wolbachia endosymbiont of Aedes albopictus]
MHRTSVWALVKGHLNFLADAVFSGDVDSITKWVKESLISENSSVEPISKNSFFDAEKSLIRGYIAGNKFEKIKALLSAVDNDEFKNEPSYRKLKLNQCKVLADAIKMAEGFLKEQESDAMHKDLSALLQAKQGELKNLDLEEREKNFRDKSLSTSINEALSIVQVSSPGSSKSK